MRKAILPLVVGAVLAAGLTGCASKGVSASPTGAATTPVKISTGPPTARTQPAMFFRDLT